MNSEFIKTDVNDYIATVTIDRPERKNALTWEMFGKLIEVFNHLALDDEVRVVVLRGGGHKAFTTGADTGSLANLSDAGRHGGDELSALGRAIAECRKPVIAMIHGFCIGGGVGLIAACDMRYAADSAVFSIPAAKLGIVYPIRACRDLYALIGPGNLSEMLMTARRYPADEAVSLGLINRVYPEPELEKAVYDIAADLKENAPLSVAGVKKIIGFAKGSIISEGSDLECLVGESFLSADFQEGLKAISEKRKPKFLGK